MTGNTAAANGDAGIIASGGSTVWRNTSIANTGVGLDLGSGVGYGENTVSSNIGGSVLGGVDAGGNVCNGATTCP